MRQTILEILNGIRPEENFNDSDDFVAEGMLDSFDLVALVADLDKAFGISIDGASIIPENFKNLTTIETLVRASGGRE